MAAAGIMLLSVAAAIVYGIIHDQITARVCVEYFTVYHRPVFPTDDPTLLGLGWGIIATWWVGFILSIPLTLAARAGRRPKRRVLSLIKPIAILLLFMGGCALMAGVAGFAAATSGGVTLAEPWAEKIPPHKHAAFIADLWAHTVSYLVGTAGGVVLCLQVWRAREYGFGKKYIGSRR